MPSVETKIWLALKSRAETAATLVGLPVAWPNENFTAPSSGYLRVRQVPNTPLRPFLGSDAPHERLGVLQIMVLAPRNQNAAVAQEMAGKIAAHFPADHAMFYDDVMVKVRQAPRVGEVVPEGTYAEVAVEVQYRCFG